MESKDNGERPLSSAPFRTREKLRRSMIAFDRFPCVSSRPFPSSTFGPPRATWLARGLETGHRGNARFGSPRLLIDANFSVYPRGEPPAPPSRVLLAKKRRRNSIRSGTTDRRDRVIKIIKIIRSSLSLSFYRRIEGARLQHAGYDLFLSERKMFASRRHRCLDKLSREYDSLRVRVIGGISATAWEKFFRKTANKRKSGRS